MWNFCKACFSICNLFVQISSHRECVSAWKHYSFTLLCMHEDAALSCAKKCCNWSYLSYHPLGTGLQTCDMPLLSGYMPVLVKDKWWNEARWEERTKQLPENKNAEMLKKKREKKMLWMSGKVTGGCTISYNSDLNPLKKERAEGREKLHSNGHETIDFIKKVCWKRKHNPA